MFPSALSRPVVIGLLFLLQACAQTQTQPPPPPPPPPEEPRAEVPEITLNLPREAPCVCEKSAPESDYTFLEKGYAALAAAEYEEAVEHFRRYYRLESSPEAKWESRIAVTYIRSLPQSPIYNAAKAREDFRELDRRDWQSLQLHPQSLFLRQSLETFDELSGQIQELARANASLREDLRKREEAIKRLRELTLGQTGAKP